MYFNRKLKPPIISTEMIIAIIASVIFLFLLAFSFIVAMGFGALITFAAAMLTLIVYIRMHNHYFIVSILAHLAATAFLLGIALGGIEKFKPWLILLAGIMLIFQTLMIIYIMQKKMKWRSREVLEMAAIPIDDVKNGFTRRPLQAGRADYSPEELIAFASFLRKSLIAIPVRETNRIIFIVNIPWNRLLFSIMRYEDRTWIAFDNDGNVSVNISQDDYFMYRDQLAFDQLCHSLGKLFIDFLERYKNEEMVYIIDRFNALKLNIITEG